jgi:hypothetical protein
VLIHFSIIPIVKIGIKTSKIVWMSLYLIHISLLIYTATYGSSNEKLGFASIMVLMT